MRALVSRDSEDLCLWKHSKLWMRTSLSMFQCMNQCKEACCLTGTQPLLIELSVWSAWLSQWLIADNSISQRNTEVAPLAPSLGECSLWRLAVSLATTGGGGTPPPDPAQLVALLKSSDLFHHHFHKLIFFLSQQPMRNSSTAGFDSTTPARWL